MTPVIGQGAGHVAKDPVTPLPLAFGVSGPLATWMMWRGEVKRHLSSAYAAGVRIFDTAPSYGNGLGEKRLGKWSRHFPDTILSTKAGVRSAGLATRIRDFSPPGIERSVRASLRRLGRPPDWLWLHGPGQHEITPQLIKGLRQLRNAGAYANLGLAVRLVDE